MANQVYIKSQISVYIVVYSCVPFWTENVEASLMWPVLSCFSLCQGGYQSVSFAQEPAGEVVALQVRGASVVGGGVGGRLSSTSTGYLQLTRINQLR